MAKSTTQEQEKKLNNEIPALVKKYKKLFGTYLKQTEFEQPIGILIRNDSKVKFYESLTGQDFKYKHTDGTERFIRLDRRQLVSFPWGDKPFKGYIMHEDIPTPLPQNPIQTTKELIQIIDEMRAISEEWKAKTLNAWKGVLKQMGTFILIAGVIFLLWTL